MDSRCDADERADLCNEPLISNSLDKMAGAAALVWQLRIQETEALLKTKQADLSSQQARKQALTQELQHGQQLQAALHMKLLQHQEQLAKAKYTMLQLRQHSAALEDSLLQGKELSAVTVQSQAAEQALQGLRATIQAEQQRMSQWRDACSQPEAPMGQIHALRQSCEQLSKRLAKIEPAMPALRDQLECNTKESQLARLQAELQAFERSVIVRQQHFKQQQSNLDDIILKVKEAEAELGYRQAQRRVEQLQSQTCSARQELAGLQSQLEGMESWLYCLRDGNVMQ